MRILYLTTDYAAGPLASLTHHTAHALVRLAQREGHPVRVGSVVNNAQAHGSSRCVGGAGVTALHADTAHANPAGFAHWLHAQQADVIHCIAPTPQAVDLPWPQALVPTVVTLTGLPEPSRRTINAVPDWLRQTRHRTCTTAAAQALWLAQYPGLAFRVLAQGVDLLALLRKFVPSGPMLPKVFDPAVAAPQPWDEVAAVRWVPLHPVSLLGLDGAVNAVVMPPPSDGAFSLIANECAALGLPCLEPSQLSAWRARWPSECELPALQAMDQPMPMRIEEEAFFYDSLYRL